jgi:hypothetical protein
MYKYPNIAATRRATVLFPDPAGPSIAIVNRSVILAFPITNLICATASDDQPIFNFHFLIFSSCAIRH